jgi:hypothetical protein
MAVDIVGGSSTANKANVDATYNLNVNLPIDPLTSGYGLNASIVDEGTVTGTRKIRELYSSEDYRLAVGIDTPQFNLSFEGTNIARDRIQQNDTTATCAQASGFLTLNSGSSTTTGQGTNIRTYRSFPLYSAASVYGDFYGKVPGYLATNAVTEFGFGLVSGVTAQVTDGILFRVSSSGGLRAIVAHNNNGSPTDAYTQDITTTNLLNRDGTAPFDPSQVQHYFISWQNDHVNFWINNVQVAEYKPLSAYGAPTSTSNLPIFCRTYNSGTASQARQLSLAYVGCTQAELALGMPIGHQAALQGGGSYQIQPGTASGPAVSRGAATLGWPTSGTVSTAGTWTATTAPALNSLGGMWVSPAISTLTSGADYPVFSYANPAGTATLPGKTLVITGIKWGKTVAQTVAATNNIILQYIVCVGGTSSATTQTEGAAIVAARGTVLDTIPFKLGAVVGDYVEGGSMDFGHSPLICYPGTFVVFAVRPTGTVTSNTLTVTGTVAFTGYYI